MTVDKGVTVTGGSASPEARAFRERSVMRFPRAVVWFRILAACLGVALLVFVACVIPGPPVRGGGDRVDPKDVANIANEEAYWRVQNTSMESNDQYALAFLEFDSSGQPGEGQVALAAKAIHRDPGTDALVVLFVHGWGHSADARDDHVIKFRKTLLNLAEDLPDRSVIGIYVSWRARWLKDPLHFLTYLDRSIVAQRLGGEDCGVRQILEKLRSAVEERRQRGDKVVSVAIGHSLGGQFLFSHMEECLDKDLDETCEHSRAQCPPRSPQALPIFGDLVLLVNPAQDTHDFEVFRAYAKDHLQARPVVVILSSEADDVIGSAYRIGRTIRNIFWWKYWNKSFGPETIGLGWDDEQVTHVLCSTAAGGSDESVCSDKGHDMCGNYGSTTLWSRTDCERPGPFMLVRVEGRVVPGHGKMFTKPFANFLQEFVAGVARIPEGAVRP